MTKCYVGTYKKYNEGNLAGKWLNLSNFQTYQDFLRACKELHKDEHDPELMIQDWENLPDGFPSVEWIGEQSFNDIKEAMQDEKKNADNDQHKAKKNKALWEEYRQRILKAENNDEYWLDYWLKNTSEIMMTDCGVILTFKKRRIEVDFCWHDEGPQYEEYLRLHSNEDAMRNYFIRENIKWYNDKIEALTTRKDRWGNQLVPVLYERETYSYGKCGWAETMRLISDYDFKCEQNDNRVLVYQMTENDCASVLAILKDERAKMEKRLNAYIKRYGTSKLHTWTYWADR